MRVLVTGGRNYKDYRSVCRILDAFHLKFGVDVIIHGNASGADKLSGHWASSNSVEQDVYPAQWSTHGRAAGPIRNQQMLDEAEPDVLVAFPGGTGTADMKRRARNAGLKIIEPWWEED